MRNKRNGVQGCLICVGGDDRCVIGGVDVTLDWLRFCLGSVTDDLFSIRLFASDCPDLLDMAADCGWPVLSITHKWQPAAILSQAIPVMNNCSRIAYLAGTESFPMQATWMAALSAAQRYPTQIIAMSWQGRRRYPFILPGDLFPELVSLPAHSSVSSVLAMHPARLHMVEVAEWYDSSNLPVLPGKPVDDPASHMRSQVHAVLSLRLFTQEKCFGPGIAQLLTHVEHLGSLRSAAAVMGMSYTKAWNIVHHSEQALGFKLMESMAGGSKGGGAVLTQEARQLILLHQDFSEKVCNYAERLLQQEVERYFPEPGVMEDQGAE